MRSNLAIKSTVSAPLAAALLVALLGCCCPSIPMILTPDLSTITQVEPASPAAPAAGARTDR